LDWKEEAADLKFKQGKSWTEVAKAMRHHFPELSEQQTWEKVRRALRTKPEYKSKGQPEQTALSISEIAKETAKADICKRHNITPRILQAHIADWRDAGYQVQETDATIALCRDIIPQENEYTEQWAGERILRFGVVSDTHLCSKWQQLTFLNHLYDLFAAEGLDKVYHPGDITEGFKMRPGHEHEIFKHGADDQSQYVIDVYPQRPGIATEFIIGNHDTSHIKNGGIDIGAQIAAKRPDMKYLGQNNARILLTPNCILELNHPLDGAAYALSYSLQKYIDSMTGGEKPNILLNGHHHKAMYLWYRNIHAFECGCLQNQTPFMRGKRISAHIGGWIIEVHVDSDGSVTRCKSEFIPCYKPVEKDY